MRIWFTAPVTLPHHNSIHPSMSMLAAELRRYGHTVRLFFPHSRSHRHPLRFSFTLALTLLMLFWKRPHWIISRSAEGLLCALTARLFTMRTKVALYSHGWEERIAEFEHRLPASLITASTPWHARIFRTALLRLMLRKSALCICATIDESRWLRRRYPHARQKIAFLSTGISESGHPYWPSQPEFPPSFLMVGSLTWMENLEYGIELFRRYLESNAAARLFIVGCGIVAKQKKQLLYNLGDAVFTVESESPQKMHRWYESCPFLLFPSRYTGERPAAILEAQSRGCIVFAADIPPVRECVTAGRSGFIMSGVNLVADVALMSTVSRNRELMMRVGTAAWKHASRNRIQRQGKRCARLLLMRMRNNKN